MKGYCSKNDIERYLLVDIDSSYDEQINEWIEVVENMIDNYTGRNFIADTEASVRNYDGDGTHELLIDDCIEVEKVEIGDTEDEKEEIDPDYYYVYPYNETPKTRIYYDGIFTYGHKNVYVTAKWGYSSECPADIKLAATILVSLIIEEAWQSEGETQTESIGSYSITYKKTEKNQSKFEMAKSILDKYRKIQV